MSKKKRSDFVIVDWFLSLCNLSTSMDGEVEYDSMVVVHCFFLFERNRFPILIWSVFCAWMSVLNYHWVFLSHCERKNQENRLMILIFSFCVFRLFCTQVLFCMIFLSVFCSFFSLSLCGFISAFVWSFFIWWASFLSLSLWFLLSSSKLIHHFNLNTFFILIFDYIFSLFIFYPIIITIIVIQAVKNHNQHRWRKSISFRCRCSLCLFLSYFVPSNKTGNLARRSSSTNSTLVCVFVEAFLCFSSFGSLSCSSSLVLILYNIHSLVVFFVALAWWSIIDWLLSFFFNSYTSFFLLCWTITIYLFFSFCWNKKIKRIQKQNVDYRAFLLLTFFNWERFLNRSNWNCSWRFMILSDRRKNQGNVCNVQRFIGQRQRFEEKHSTTSEIGHWLCTLCPLLWFRSNCYLSGLQTRTRSKFSGIFID